ncbi:MAG TPA: hypothetical protein VN231_11520 [Allosphingosinicella sp.]|nr:hypothetical protein [Allosphingosinicella sp.]
MKALTKYLAGAATVAAFTLSAAAPAQAQSWDRYRDRDRGIDVGDVVAGVAILGGIAAVISAIDGDDRYGYGYGRSDYRYGYGNDRYGHGGARSAVNVCAREAQRIGRNVQITDLDRSNGGFRVRGRIDVADYDGRGWNRRYDIDREDFTCFARNGRIYDFRV